MKKISLSVLIAISVFLLLSASVWEGSASVGEAFPQSGDYVATNSYPINTVVYVTNLENGMTIPLLVTSNLEISGILALLSKDAGEKLGISYGSVGRIRMSESPDLFPISAFGGELVIPPEEPMYTPDEIISNDRFENGEMIVNLPAISEIQAIPEYQAPIYIEPEYVEPDYIVLEPDFTILEEPECVEPEPLVVEPECVEPEPLAVEPECVEPEPLVVEPVYEEPEPIVLEPVYEEPEPIVLEPVYEEPEPIVLEPVYVEPEPIVLEPVYVEPEPIVLEPVYVEPEPIVVEPVYVPPEPIIVERIVVVPEYRVPDGFMLVPAETRPPVEEKIPDPAYFITRIPEPRYIDPQNVEPQNVAPQYVAPLPSSQSPAPVSPEAIAPEVRVSGMTSPPVSQFIAPPVYQFSSPMISSLEAGKYYVQIAAFSKIDSVENELAKIENILPKAVMQTGTDETPIFRVLIGPLNLGESGAILQRYKSIYKDAFVRQGN